MRRATAAVGLGPSRAGVTPRRAGNDTRRGGSGRPMGADAMLLAPNRTKYRKQHRGRMRGTAHSGNTIAFGEFALQALEPIWLEARQIEAARIAMNRYIKRGGKVWIRVFPDKPVSAKPAETRMGSGKGAPDHWVAVVKPGRILFEMAGVDHESAVEAMRLASHKLPVATRVVMRESAKESN